MGKEKEAQIDNIINERGNMDTDFKDIKITLK